MPETGTRFHWFLPTVADRIGYAVGDPVRDATAEYIREVARAAEANDFDSLLLATGHSSPDTWILASLAAAATESIRFILAFRTGYSLPTLVAQQIDTFQRLFDDRLYVNIVTGSDLAEQSAYGDVLSKADRYRRTEEFLSVLRSEFAGAPYDFTGRFYSIEGGGRPSPLITTPKIFFGGLSSESGRIGAVHADVQLMYGETPPMAAEHVERVSTQAAAQGRDIEFGIRIHVIARESREEALAETTRILESLTPELVAARQAGLAQRASEGQRRVQSLNPGVIDARKLWPHQGIWSGLGLIGGGGGSTALVGSYEDVAASITEYRQVGIRHFIVSGAPLLEEAYRFGRHVTPLVREAESEQE